MESIAFIKFKPVGKIYSFDAGSNSFEVGEGVIVETTRGLEYGEIEKATASIAEVNEDYKVNKFIRKATEKDYKTLEKNINKAVEYSKIALSLIKKLKLEMKLIDSELTFDASKVIFTFTAEGRVDFRGLLKELANKLKLRIELKQVGARDEAKIIGGLGPCGRPICCANHMREFHKVGIKMAKTQNLALNPSKINGLCNRLMCCLAYENDYYSETLKLMPKVGKKINTPEGEGIVVYNDILKKLVSIKFIDKEGTINIEKYSLADLKLETKELEANNSNACNCPLKKQNANT